MESKSNKIIIIFFNTIIFVCDVNNIAVSNFTIIACLNSI